MQLTKKKISPFPRISPKNPPPNPRPLHSSPPPPPLFFSKFCTPKKQKNVLPSPLPQLSGSEFSAEIITSTPDNVSLGDSIGRHIEVLWKEPSIKETFQVGLSNLSSLKSSAYFFDDIIRISYPNYTPTDEDILQSCYVTTGIADRTFNLIERGENIKVVCTGGRKNERTKWKRCFDDV